MMMNGNTDSEYSESAYGASSDSGSSEERRKSKKIKKLKARKKKKKEEDKDKDNEPKKSTSPLQEIQPQEVSSRRAGQMHVEQYKGYRFKSIYDELEVDFKPCHKFKADLGGYAEKEGSESK